jgi:hypothetical protein
MKEASRLAQSLYQQVIEKVVIFYPFSRSPRADSGAFEKYDSSADSAPWSAVFLAVVAAGMAGCRGPAREGGAAARRRCPPSVAIPG